MGLAAKLSNEKLVNKLLNKNMGKLIDICNFNCLSDLHIYLRVVRFLFGMVNWVQYLLLYEYLIAVY